MARSESKRVVYEWPNCVGGVVKTPFMYAANTYCPNCGRQGVWEQDQEGDYYLGPTYICTSCESEGHHWDGHKVSDIYNKAIPLLKKEEQS